jgi:hypothetical protein
MAGKAVPSRDSRGADKSFTNVVSDLATRALPRYTYLDIPGTAPGTWAQLQHLSIPT